MCPILLGMPTSGSTEQWAPSCADAEQSPNVLFCVPNRTKCILTVAAKQGPNVLFFVPNRINCIVFLSVFFVHRN
jgi:hypothetical protein